MEKEREERGHDIERRKDRNHNRLRDQDRERNQAHKVCFNHLWIISI
jgi:hypothetical protein